MFVKTKGKGPSSCEGWAEVRQAEGTGETVSGRERGEEERHGHQAPTPPPGKSCGWGSAQMPKSTARSRQHPSPLHTDCKGHRFICCFLPFFLSLLLDV